MIPAKIARSNLVGLLCDLSEPKSTTYEILTSGHRLIRSQNICFLNLSRNFLYPLHLEVIAVALAGHPSLRELDLSMNRLSGVWKDRWQIEHGKLDMCGINALATVLGGNALLHTRKHGQEDRNLDTRGRNALEGVVAGSVV